MSDGVYVVGGGLAGCEAAWQLACRGVDVVLYEMRPERKTDVHKTDGLAELVCSNSFRSDDHETSAVGLLHEEMRLSGSLVMRAADSHAVPAGGALAVDRDGFSSSIEAEINAHPRITINRKEIPSLDDLPPGRAIIASGPLTSSGLASSIRERTGEDDLAFFDAIAPIVYRDSINMDKAWFQSRYDRSSYVGDGETSAGNGKDYINCPLDAQQYHHFITALLEAEKMAFREWEENTPYFEGCMPVEIMAERGKDTLRFGPMKPVGLTDPATGRRPHAVVQLRQDNALGTLYNMVGFQTKMKYGEQQRVFRLVPGLENAEFARLGGLHRNTFIRSPKLLDAELRLKQMPRCRFAGQITGVEGYVESAAIGLMAGIMTAAEQNGKAFIPPPPTTAHGALLAHITGGADDRTFQPMNINFGLLMPLDDAEASPTGEKRRKPKGVERKKIITARAIAAMKGWLDATGEKPDGHAQGK